MFAILEFTDFCLIALIVMVFASGAAAHAYFKPSDAARLRRVEWKLNLILKHLGIEQPDPETAAGLSQEVRSLADNPARKIEAIKLHREQTGVRLRQAKDAVEEYMAARRDRETGPGNAGPPARQ